MLKPRVYFSVNLSFLFLCLSTNNCITNSISVHTCMPRSAEKIKPNENRQQKNSQFYSIQIKCVWPRGFSVILSSVLLDKLKAIETAIYSVPFNGKWEKIWYNSEPHWNQTANANNKKKCSVLYLNLKYFVFRRYTCAGIQTNRPKIT